MSELYDLNAVELSALLKRREVSAREIAEAAISHVEAVDPRVKAFLTVTGETALAQADALDARGGAQMTTNNARDVTPVEALRGIPVALKDNLCTRGVRTTCGSRILPDYRPPYSATVVERLEAAGAVLIGKTNCDEFAMGSSTENSGYGPSRNPWDLSRVPGGSSGGSAVAVAAGETVLALGSDTGGSIRQPAALCGIVGMKPTYGRVSRYGLVAYASSLDQIGPMARCVADVALLLTVISGKDPRDSTSVDLPVPDFRAACCSDAARDVIRALRIGVPKEYFGSGVAPEVGARVRAAIEVLCGLGATAEECTLPTTEYGLAAYYVLAPAEASSNLARYDGVRFGHRTKELAGASNVIGLMEKTRDEGFGDEVKQRIMIGTYALSAGYYDAYYKRAQQVRTLIRRDFDRAFDKYDVLLTPTSPTVAFPIGERSDDPLAMKLADTCTLPVNMAGLPAISVPCGFSDGLPVGLQIIGKPFDEETILSAAYAYEQATDWHKRRPTL